MRHVRPDVHPDMIDQGSPSQSRADWHPADILIRRAGYRIAARPKGGPALWWNARGKLVAQDVALSVAEAVDAERRLKAREKAAGEAAPEEEAELGGES